MTRWSPDDIAWNDFDPSRLDPDILKVIKAASMVERNAADYTVYLGNIFCDDPEFLPVLAQWRAEEVQHGDVLGRYAEMADPSFDFHSRFQRFRAGYRVPVDLEHSVRGSLSGELLARCMVETGTSSYYSALRDATGEPVLKSICHRIAVDEFRHYKTFYTRMMLYRDRDRIGLPARVLVAIGRIRETDDDELAYAWHAANEDAGTDYDLARCNREYGRRAFGYYRRPHAERAVTMVLKAIGLGTSGWLAELARRFAWSTMRRRAGKAAADAG